MKKFLRFACTVHGICPGGLRRARRLRTHSDAPESEAPADVTEPADEGGDTAESDMAYVQDK